MYILSIAASDYLGPFTLPGGQCCLSSLEGIDHKGGCPAYTLNMYTFSSGRIVQKILNISARAIKSSVS